MACDLKSFQMKLGVGRGAYRAGPLPLGYLSPKVPSPCSPGHRLPSGRIQAHRCKSVAGRKAQATFSWAQPQGTGFPERVTEVLYCGYTEGHCRKCF